MAKLSGFADEISADLAEQIEGLKACGVGHIALRGAWGKNVMAWTDDECDRIRRMLDEGGIGVSEIGSPVGKTPIDAPFEKVAESLARAVKLCEKFATPNIRMFSFYPPENAPADGWLDAFRDEVLDRLRRMADQVAGTPAVLMLENESRLYGDDPARCADIFENVKAPKLRLAFDFANFVHSKDVGVYENAWKPLRPFVAHVHAKDHVPGAPHSCVVGEGAGQVAPALADLARDGYDGFITLEPHLAKAGQFGGFSGLENFHRATDALRALCSQVGLPVA